MSVRHLGHRDETTRTAGSEPRLDGMWQGIQPLPDKRSFILRYFQINLPRVTKAAFVLVILALAAAQVATILVLPPPFTGSTVALAILAACCAVFTGMALFTRIRPWTLGFIVCIVSVAVWGLGKWQHAPSVAAGDTTGQIALWNANVLLPVVYAIAYAALRYGILVAHPDQRRWHD